jgi:hypothetical protein
VILLSTVPLLAAHRFPNRHSSAAERARTHQPTVLHVHRHVPTHHTQNYVTRQTVMRTPAHQHLMCSNSHSPKCSLTSTNHDARSIRTCANTSRCYTGSRGLSSGTCRRIRTRGHHDCHPEPWECNICIPAALTVPSKRWLHDLWDERVPDCKWRCGPVQAHVYRGDQRQNVLVCRGCWELLSTCVIVGGCGWMWARSHEHAHAHVETR